MFVWVKRILAVALAAALALTMTSCTKPENKVVKSNPKVIFVTDVGGLGDQSFNDAIWTACEDASDEYGADVRCLESNTGKEVISNTEDASNDEPVVVVTCGKNGARAVKRTAKDHPDINYVVIDYKVDLPNVASVFFKEQEGSFLAGVAAAMKTETNKVGFVGGINSSSMRRFYYGFRAGVKTADKDVKVLKTFTGSYNSRIDGMSAAKKLYAEGADVIFTASGLDNTGVIKYAGLKNFWVIGSDKDQSGLDSNHVMCSMTKNLSVAVDSEVKAAVKGHFKAETVEYGLKEEGVALSDKAGNLNDDEEDAVAEWQHAIIKGRFKVPFSKSTYADFEIPKLK
mgnify:CR=1 FL=1|jgi:Uncharacterized ABC-type transport system, periplasmic component/surface lipoprotein